MFDMINMFQAISIIGFAVTVVGIALHSIAFPCGAERWWERQWDAIEILKKLVYLLTLLFLEQKLSLVGALKKLVYLLAMLCFVVLVVTGFYRPLVLGEHISGYLMMVHATFAPVFAVCLAVLAVMWARHCRLDQSDCPPLQYILQRVTRPAPLRCGARLKTAGEPARRTAGELLCKSSRLGQKVTFWLIIFLALPLILSIILSMFPLFGTHWQELLLSMHRYTALVFVLVVIVHIYLVIRTKMQE